MGVHVWKIIMSVFIQRFTEPGGYRGMHQEPGSLGSLGSRCSGEGGEPQKRCCQRLGEKGSVVTFLLGNSVTKLGLEVLKRGGHGDVTEESGKIAF